MIRTPQYAMCPIWKQGESATLDRREMEDRQAGQRLESHVLEHRRGRRFACLRGRERKSGVRRFAESRVDERAIESASAEGGQHDGAEEMRRAVEERVQGDARRLAAFAREQHPMAAAR